MRQIALDATHWKVPLDFYDALLPAIGAPAWHGESVGAIDDSMIGGINKLKPPHAVRIYNMGNAPAAVIDEVERAVSCPAEVRASFRETHGETVEVGMEIVK